MKGKCLGVERGHLGVFQVVVKSGADRYVVEVFDFAGVLSGFVRLNQW